MLRRICIFFILLSAAGSAACASPGGPSRGTPRRSVSGLVYFRDTTERPAPYVMVFSPRYGIGTLTDEDGRYCISIPQCDEAELEYSIMGWHTEYRTVTPGGRSAAASDTVFLSLQPVMLAAAYLTPEGWSASKYILSQVWKTADRNRKKIAGYQADVTYNIASHGIPEVSTILSWFKIGLLKIAAGRFGYTPLLKYVLSHDDFYAKASLHRVVKGSKATDSDNRLLESSAPLPPKVSDNILSLFSFVNLYEMLYGEGNEWGKKFSSKHEFELVGTYEWGRHLVDILTWQDKNSKVRATVHVVEDIWGVLKIEIGRGPEVITCEARDVGEGIFMPICFIVKPELMRIKAEEIPVLIDDLENNRRLDRQMTRKAVELLRKHEGSDYNPYITVGYTVEYSDVSLKRRQGQN